MTIWKFPLEPSCEIEMPEGAKYLSVGVQHGMPCLWALVDPNAPRVMREPVIVGTGYDADPSLRFVGTFMLNGGTLVFHVFEDKP